jgi:hypothetical protein
MERKITPSNGRRRCLEIFSCPSLAATLAVILGMMTSASSAPAPAAYPTEKIWNALLTHCGDSWFYAGSALDGKGDSYAYDRKPTLIEFRGVQFLPIVAIRVTDAERLNGLGAHARVTMFAHVYRKKGEDWRDGPDLVYRDTGDIMARANQDVEGDDGQMGSGGVIALDLQLVEGRWLVRRNSVRMQGDFGYDRVFDVARLSEARIGRYNCPTGAITPPPPTAEEAEAAATAKAKSDRVAAVRAAIKAEEAASRADTEAALAAYNARFASKNDAATKQREQEIAPWTFTGTPAEFHAALANNLRRRAAQWGLDPDSYGWELSMIDQIVEGCAAITPAQWRAARDQFIESTRTGAQPGGLSPVMLRSQRLNWCDTTRGSSATGERISASNRVHGLGVIKAIPLISQTFRGDSDPAGYFSITVTVFPQRGEITRRPLYADDLPGILDVIKANIPMQGWTLHGSFQ